MIIKFKNIIGSLIIISVIIMPFSGLTPKANAQMTLDTGSTFGTGTGTSTGSNSAGAYLHSVGPLAADLPGCISEIGTGISNLFGGGSLSNGNGYFFGDDDSDTSSDNQMGPPTEDQYLNTAQSSASSQDISVPVYDTNVTTKLDKILSNTGTIKKSTSAVDKNQNCLNAIGKSIVKLIIQKMTLSIVNWIQTGNSGGPFFLTNPGKFFGDIAKNQILNFGLEMNDSSQYPFAKSFMQGVANSFNNTFQKNAQYSLDKMIQQTNPGASSITFNNDFSQGGWGAWEAMTQVPANNPLGFQLMASNELGARLAGTNDSPAQIVKDQLQQANGFLSQTICADPYGVTKEQDQRARAGESASQAFTDANGHVLTPEECTGGWETQTPGTVIGHELTKSMDNNDNSLLDASTLNDAIAAIADASMAKFSNELTSKTIGLAGMDTNSANYQSDTSSITPTPSQTQSDYSSNQIAASTWLQQNPNFNIRTDLNQALIDQQRTYVDKLTSENTALTDLIKWIHQLDDCIPGPNPDWETDATNNIDSFGNGSGPKVKTSWLVGSTAGKVGGTVGGFLDPSGIISGIVGIIVGVTDQSRISNAYANLISTLLQVYINPKQKQVMDMGGVTNLLNNIFNSYRSVIDQTYFTSGTNIRGIDASTYMPPVTDEAWTEFEKIVGYNQMIANNTTEVESMKGIITRLTDIKSAVDTLNGQLASSNLDETQYETNLAAYIQSFGRLSSSLVSGDDISAVDSVSKQADDEKDYVINNLVGDKLASNGTYEINPDASPDSCEPFLLKLWNTNPNTYLTYVSREPYPFPVDHEYAGWGAGPLIWDTNNCGGYGVNSTADTDGTHYCNYVIIPSHYVAWNTKLQASDPSSSINQGFLYGSAYWNNTSSISGWATDNPNGYGGIDPPMVSHAFPQGCVDRWIHSVLLTANHSRGGDSGDPADIGGLDPDIAGGSAINNTCGVVLTFEKKFGIY